MLYRFTDVMDFSFAVRSSKLSIETVGDRLIGNDTDTLIRQQSSSFLITLDVVGIVYQAGEIYAFFEFCYHHIRNLESNPSVVVSILSTLVTTMSKPMPFAHRAS